MKIPYLWHGELTFAEGVASLEGGLIRGGPLYKQIPQQPLRNVAKFWLNIGNTHTEVGQVLISPKAQSTSFSLGGFGHKGDQNHDETNC